MQIITKFLVFAILITGVMTSCSNNGNAQNNQQENDRPEHGPRQDGERKGPPGGGHNPEQTKTLEEIGGYKLGETAADFELQNVDGSMVSLSTFKEAKGYIVVFTCNECPFAKMYEDRLIELHNTYAAKGYPVITINPNVSEDNDKESFEAMRKRAEEKNFPYPYLADTNHEIFPKYGAVRTPHVFLLDSERKVQYIGTIDDNAKSADNVKMNYVKNAIEALENGAKPNPNFTKAIGCPVKAS